MPVILLSLDKKVVAYPSVKRAKSISSDQLFLSIGASELRFVWNTQILVSPKEPSKVSHFDRKVRDIVGEERMEIEEFEVFEISFEKE